MRTPEVPLYALVLWPKDDRCLPACITLDRLAAAVQRGALVLAREDDILRDTPRHFNPIRYWHRGDEGFR